MYVLMHLSDAHHVSVSQIVIHSLGKSAHQKIILETLQQNLVRTFFQRLLAQKMFANVFYPLLSDPCRPKELFKIQRIHLLNGHAPERNRRCFRQCHPKLRTTGDETIARLLIEKLQHGQQMGITLNLIQKNQRVGLVSQRRRIVIS